MRFRQILMKKLVQVLLIASSVMLGLVVLVAAAVMFLGFLVARGICMGGFSTESGLGGPNLEIRSELRRTDPQFAPQWTSDGAHIVFTTRHWTSNDPHGETPGFPGVRLHAAASDGSSLIRMSRDERDVIHHSPSISPDGSRIAYSSFQIGELGDFLGSYDLETVALDGSYELKLTERAGLDHFAAWSPDGTRIAFQRHDVYERCKKGSEEASGLFVTNADGSNLRPILILNDAEFG